MDIISLPDNWMSAYEPIEYKLYKKSSLNIDDPGDYLGLVAATTTPLYYKLKCYGVGPLLLKIGDRINIQYNNTVAVGQLFNRNFIVTGFDTDNNPILDTLVGSFSLPPGTTNYKGFAFIYARAPKVFKLYAGYPSWHPKFSIRSIETLLAEIRVSADLDFVYNVRVEAFLQSILDNPIPLIGNDQQMYIGFKLISVDEGLENQIGEVYYCLNSVTQELNASTFVSASAQLTDYQAIKFNSKSVIVSKIIDDSVINQLL
jgi:hypothetical protein